MTQEFLQQLQQDIKQLEEGIARRQKFLDNLFQERLINEQTSLLQAARAENMILLGDQAAILSIVDNLESVKQSIEAARAQFETQNDTAQQLLAELEATTKEIQEAFGHIENSATRQVITDANELLAIIRTWDQRFITLASESNIRGNISPPDSGAVVRRGELQEIQASFQDVQGRLAQMSQTEDPPQVLLTSIEARLQHWKQLLQQATLLRDMLDRFNELPLLNIESSVQMQSSNEKSTLSVADVQEVETWAYTLWLMHKVTDRTVYEAFKSELYAKFIHVLKQLQLSGSFITNQSAYPAHTLTGSPAPLIQVSDEKPNANLLLISVISSALSVVLAVGLVVLLFSLGVIGDEDKDGAENNNAAVLAQETIVTATSTNVTTETSIPSATLAATDTATVTQTPTIPPIMETATSISTTTATLTDTAIATETLVVVTETVVPTEASSPTLGATDMPTLTSTTDAGVVAARPVETATVLPTDTPTLTLTLTATETSRPTATATLTPSVTEIPTDTPTLTATPTTTPSETPTTTQTPSPTNTETPSPTVIPTITLTPTPTLTPQPLLAVNTNLSGINLRDASASSSNFLGTVEPGVPFRAIGQDENGEDVSGDTVWYEINGQDIEADLPESDVWVSAALVSTQEADLLLSLDLPPGSYTAVVHEPSATVYSVFQLPTQQLNDVVLERGDVVELRGFDQTATDAFARVALAADAPNVAAFPTQFWVPLGALAYHETSLAADVTQALLSLQAGGVGEDMRVVPSDSLWVIRVEAVASGEASEDNEGVDDPNAIRTMNWYQVLVISGPASGVRQASVGWLSEEQIVVPQSTVPSEFDSAGIFDLRKDETR